MPKSHITVEDKILLHLSCFAPKNEFEAPAVLTQPGIAGAIGVKRSHVSQSLKRLKDREMVTERLAHVSGNRRRRKIYSLMENGVNHIVTLKEDLNRREVKYLAESGEIMTKTVQEITRITKASIIQVMNAIGADNTFDASHLQHLQGSESGETFVHFMERAPQLSRFHGRQKEVEEIATLIGDEGNSSVIVIHGIAGIGKTTLSLKIAEMCKGKRNVFWSKMHEWDSVRGILEPLAEFLNSTGRSKLKRYLENEPKPDIGEVYRILDNQLDEFNAIIIFDDFHKVREDNIPLFSMLLELFQDLNDLHMLITSREIPPFYDRRDVMVNKIVKEIKLGGLDLESSKHLIHGDELRFNKIYSLTGGHPLFMELMDMLQDTDTLMENVNQFIQGEILSKLGENEKQILSVLSVYTKPVMKEAFLQDNISYDVIDSLVNHSLINVIKNNYFELHDVIKEFFFHRLTDEERKNYDLKASEYYQEYEPRSIEVMHHLISAGEIDRTVDVAVIHGEEFISRGFLDELMNYISKIIYHDMEKEKVLKPAQKGELLYQKGKIHTVWREETKALEDYKASLKAFEENNDEENMAEACAHIAENYYDNGEIEMAIDYFARSIEILENLKEARKLEDLTKLDYDYYMSGIFLWEHDQLEEAIEMFLKRRSLLKEIDQDTYDVDFSISKIYYELNKTDRAMEYIESCLSQGRFSFDNQKLCEIYTIKGNILMASKKKKAIECFDTCLALANESNNLYYKRNSLKKMAELYKKSNPKKAKKYSDEAKTIYEELSDRHMDDVDIVPVPLRTEMSK